jgi:hypothetical protein
LTAATLTVCMIIIMTVSHIGKKTISDLNKYLRSFAPKRRLAF